MTFLKFAALAHKVWREARTPFLVASCLVLLNCWLCVNRTYQLVQQGQESPDVAMVSLYIGTYRIWGILITLLGAGSLQWEQRQGGREFTMALPVYGITLNLIRGLVGVFHIAALIIIPGLLVNIAHSFLFPSFAIPVAPLMPLYGITIGIMIYGLTMLCSALVRNIFLATIAGWTVFCVVDYIFQLFPSTHLFVALQALMFLGSREQPSMPWLPLMCNLVLGFASMGLAAYFAERRQETLR